MRQYRRRVQTTASLTKGHLTSALANNQSNSCMKVSVILPKINKTERLGSVVGNLLQIRELLRQKRMWVNRELQLNYSVPPISKTILPILRNSPLISASLWKRIKKLCAVLTKLWLLPLSLTKVLRLTTWYRMLCSRISKPWTKFSKKSSNSCILR